MPTVLEPSTVNDVYGADESRPEAMETHSNSLAYRVYDKRTEIKPEQPLVLNFNPDFFSEEVFIRDFKEFFRGGFRCTMAKKGTESSKWATFTFEIIGNKLHIKKNPSLVEAIFLKIVAGTRGFLR